MKFGGGWGLGDVLAAFEDFAAVEEEDFVCDGLGLKNGVRDDEHRAVCARAIILD